MESHLQVPKILSSVSYIKSELQEEEMVIYKWVIQKWKWNVNPNSRLI